METKEILIAERKKRNMTQQEVADYLHIARGSYAKYETGANTPTTENIVKLAELYHLSTDYLLGKKPSIIDPVKKISDKMVTITTLLAFLAGLSEQDKKLFMSGQMKFSQFTSSDQFKNLTPEQQIYAYQEYEQQQWEKESKEK